MLETDRCPGCGLTDTDAWWVAAEIVSCPTCEDRDRLTKSLHDQKQTAGLRVRFDQLATVDESMTESAAARFTLAGAEARARWRRQRSLKP